MKMSAILVQACCLLWAFSGGAADPTRNGLRVAFPGVVGEETLVRFPVPVRLSESIEGFSYAKYTRESIRFRTDAGVEVPFEIDTWNPSGESLVWVQVPELTKDTALYIRSNGDREKDYTQEDGGLKMWQDYIAVWHMGNVTSVRDATGNGYDATGYAADPSKGSLSLVSAGRLGSAVRWPKVTSSNIGFNAPGTIYRDKLYEKCEMSVECVVNVHADYGGLYPRIFQYQLKASEANTGVLRGQRSSTSGNGKGFWTTVSTEKYTNYGSRGSPNANPDDYNESVFARNEQTFHGMTYCGKSGKSGALTNYTGSAEALSRLVDVNSEFGGKINRTPQSGDQGNLWIGYRGNGNAGIGNWYDSEIDELRIAAKARSEEWMENCRRSMLHAETYVDFKYVSGQVPVYDVAADEANDVSNVDWRGEDTERIIVTGAGTLTMGGSFPAAVTLRGNNTIQIDDTSSASPHCNFAFEHDEASLTLDVLIPAEKLMAGNPIEVLTGTDFKSTDDSRIAGLIRIRNAQREISYAADEDIKVSVHNGSVYLTYGATSDFDIDVEKGMLTLNVSGEFDLADYDFEIRELIVNAPVVLKDFRLGNDLAGRLTPGIDLKLGESGSVDLRLLADDNYFVGQVSCIFSSVTGYREGAVSFKWNSSSLPVTPPNAAPNGLVGCITNEAGRVLFRATASANPLIDIRDYETSFVIDFPGYDDDKAAPTNYPVGVVFSNAIPGFNYACVQPESLRFADEYGNELPYEIENGAFNTGGESVVWVRLPYLRKGMTVKAGVKVSGATAPVYEGDRAMCVHPLSTDPGFDPDFARVRFNPDLTDLQVVAPEGVTVDLSSVDFNDVTNRVIKKGPGGLRFGGTVPRELEIEAGTVQFTSGAVPKKVAVNDGVSIIDLPMGNDLADNESVLDELNVRGEDSQVLIVLNPSEGLYAGQVQEVIRKVIGDGSHVEVRLQEDTPVRGELTTTGGRVVFTCSESEVPLVDAHECWCEMRISFPRHATDEVLTNFPVAVRFNESIPGFRYRTARFETLRFADELGNDLPYEVDGYDEQGTTLVWVMVPYFTKTTTLTACWGRDGESPAVTHTGPRAPFHNYAAVWHMNVKDDKSIVDSTQNGFDLKFFGSSEGFAFDSGHIGSSVTWPKNSAGNGWAVRNGLYEQKIALRPGLSTEVLASSSDSFGAEAVLLCTTRKTNFNHGYLKVDPGKHGASRFHVTHTAEVDAHLAATEWDVSGFSQADLDALTDHSPVFFGGVFDGSAHRVFNYFNLNADSHARDKIDVMPLIAGDVSDVRVGAREGAVDYDFRGGVVDEVRISDRARSAEWMNQIYHTFFDEEYASCEVIRDGMITIDVDAEQTLDRTGADYDTRVVRKTGAGMLTFGSAPDVLRLDAGAVEFTRSGRDDLPFEVAVADGTTLAGIVLAPTNVFPSVVKIADGAQWNLVLTPPDLLWEGDVVTVIPKCERAIAGNISVSLAGMFAELMQVEPEIDASGAICVRVTRSPRGLQKWSTYTHMMTIYFTGYKELETLENFPALVRLSNKIGGFSYDQFVNKPTDPVFDLRFADYHGNEIPYEIDTWNENGESLIWVSVPKLSAGGRILMYWGLAKGEDGNYKELLPTDYTGEHGVWKEYDVVYHFNEIDVKDQTENHNDPEKYHWQSAFCVVDSAVGRAVHFTTNGASSANTGYILRDYYQNWMLGVTNHTIECVATMSKALDGYAKILSVTRTPAPGTAYSTANYLYRLTADSDLNGMWGSFVYTKDGPASNGQRWYKSYWTPNGESPRDLNATNRVPVFVGCVFDGEKREYTDYTAGKYATRQTDVRTILGESTTGYDPVSIGFRYGYSGQGWKDNYLDEFRMCRKARSPAWMNAVNMNALRNGEFCLYSVEVAHGNVNPIINSAVVEVSAAGATLLVTLPNAGVVNESRLREADIYGKVWELGTDEPPEWELFGTAREGHYISSSRMIYEPNKTYRAVVRAVSRSGQTTLDSNVETNEFTTLSRGIEVNEAGTKDESYEHAHARVHVSSGGKSAEVALTQPGYVEMLVLGGGGSGGRASSNGAGGGGGAGGLFYRPAMWVETGSYQIVAAGGTASGSSGGASWFGKGIYEVSGGGVGMGYTDAGSLSWAVAGGSGGGGFSSDALNMTMGTGDQGYWGGFPAGKFTGSQSSWYSWAGAGGGGATMDGETSEAEEDHILGDAGQGGEGRVICITGREEFYGGGGGGGVARSDDSRAGARTYAGGGAGGDGRHVDGYDGEAGTGGGGGGGAWYPGKGDLYPASANGKGGKGGSGVVIWRYTPVPEDLESGPVVVLAEVRGDNCSANLTVPVICTGAGVGEPSIVSTDEGDGHYRLTRTDRVCTLYFQYGVDRFDLDHEVTLSDKAHLGEHTFKVEGLLRNQAYWGRIRAVDGAGHEYLTRELPFETTDEGDDSAVDAGYPRLGEYAYVTTNGHEVVFSGTMLTEDPCDVRLYLATNVNDLVVASRVGAWNNCYSTTAGASAGRGFVIRAADLVPGTRYWYMIEAEDQDGRKDRTHHQYTTFVTPYAANLSRTYRENKDFEDDRTEIQVEFSEVLKETGSLPARLEFVITQVNETRYADDHVVASWPLLHAGDPSDGQEQDGGCGLYHFMTNFPYGTMVQYRWRVVNLLDEEWKPTDSVDITTYVGNPNLFYWVRPSALGAGDWWDPANWHNPNVNYRNPTSGEQLPLNEWPLPGVGSTVIFTNMVDGATVNVTGRCDILRVNLSIGTNRVTFVGKDTAGERAELVTRHFMTSGSGSSLVFDNLKVPLAEGSFDWFREALIVEDGVGTRTVVRDVDEAHLTVTNRAELVLGDLVFAPLRGELKICEGAKLAVGVGTTNGVARIGGGVTVSVADAEFSAGSVYLQHCDPSTGDDPRRSIATVFDFRGSSAALTVERGIGGRYGSVDTPFVFHVPLGGWDHPVVWQKGLGGLSAFGFGFENGEAADGVRDGGTGRIVVRVAEDSPAYRSVRTVNPVLVRADQGFWRDENPYVRWWVSENQGLALSARAGVEDIDRGWRRHNEVCFDTSEAVSGNYGPTLVRTRITGRQRTVLTIEANDGEVVHRRGVVSAELGKYRLGSELPEADPSAWTLERHSADTWNDCYVRVHEESAAESETNRELYVGVDLGSLGMKVVKNMDAFSTYADVLVKVQTAWTEGEPIDIGDKDKIAVTFDHEGRLCVVSGALSDTDVTVTNATDVTVEDGAVVRIVIQAARNVQKKEYFKVFADGRAAAAVNLRDLQGLWLVPDALDGKVFPARTIGRNPIGMGAVGLGGSAVLENLAVGARPPVGYEEILTHATVTADGTIVPIPYSYVDSVRTDNTTPADTIAKSEWKNGYRLWASYALGLDPTDEMSVFWTNGRINPDNVRNYLMTPMNVEPPEGLLAEIGYRLQYSSDGSEWIDAYTLLGGDANFRIDNYATKIDGAASYVRLAAMVAGGEIPSVNTFGSMKIESPLERVPIAVPWVACDRNIHTNRSIALSEYVAVGDLDDGDYVLALDELGDRYLGWVCQEGTWQPVDVISNGGYGQVLLERGGEPEMVKIPCGSAVWVIRSRPLEDGVARRFHLVGQVPGGESETRVKPGVNLLASPLSTAFDFSKLTDGVAVKDQIFVPQADGELKLYTFENGEWGTLVKTTTTKQLGVRTVTLVTTTRRTDQNVVPLGHGFWYVSSGGTPLIKWHEGKAKGGEVK